MLNKYSKKFRISGSLNNYEIVNKEFKNYDDAIKFLNDYVTRLNVEVSDIYEEDKKEIYVVDDYTRFLISEIR